MAMMLEWLSGRQDKGEWRPPKRYVHALEPVDVTSLEKSLQM